MLQGLHNWELVYAFACLVGMSLSCCLDERAAGLYTFSYNSAGVKLWYTTVGFRPESLIAAIKPVR